MAFVICSLHCGVGSATWQGATTDMFVAIVSGLLSLRIKAKEMSEGMESWSGAAVGVRIT